MSGESERETRIRRIDPRLQRTGWTPQDFRSAGESKMARTINPGSVHRFKQPKHGGIYGIVTVRLGHLPETSTGM
jgi:hypothetical protein